MTSELTLRRAAHDDLNTIVPLPLSFQEALATIGANVRFYWITERQGDCAESRVQTGEMSPLLFC